jgi:glucose-6-phosphate 1-dehydrogenase
MKMNRIQQPAILVIIGISGDLAKRKLLPAIREIADAGILPEQLKIVGISRRQLKPEDILPKGDQPFLRGALELVQMDLADQAAYVKLMSLLQTIEKNFSKPAQRLFYLSVPPQTAKPIVRMLGEAGLSTPSAKLLLEKPFGTDLASAQDLIDNIQLYFKEEQVYRIDHYMAKEMSQNILVFRANNSLFRRTWNNEFVASIEIIASEQIGIEGRSAFYEQTGALRDLVQNHLLELAALTLMELPASDGLHAIPKKRLKALQQLAPPADMHRQVTRGQYQGYRNEVANPDSSVETFVSLTLYSRDPRWEGVPITLTAGKMLDKKTTEIRIHYTCDEHSKANQLTLRIQPNEGAEVCLWTKKPGYEHALQLHPLDFSYSNQYTELPEAYERVFVDAMRADHSLFTTSEEVLASWRILEPVQRAWSMGTNPPVLYKPGETPGEIIEKKA